MVRSPGARITGSLLPLEVSAETKLSSSARAVHDFTLRTAFPASVFQFSFNL